MIFKNIHFFTIAAVLTGNRLATSSSEADVSSLYKRDQGNSNHSPVIIPEDSPNQFWFGQDHKDTPATVLQSDALIDQALSWNVPWSLIQIAQEKPGQPRNVQEVLRPTVKQYDNNFDSLSSPQKYFLSCFNDDNRAIQAKLNANCKKEPCAVSYFMYDLWGTRGHMNYAIDGVMARACGIVSVKGEGKDCDFPNGPGCQIKFVQDFTLLQDSGVNGIQQMGQFHNTQEIVEVMESFANATHQKFTLPDGSMTH